MKHSYTEDGKAMKAYDLYAEDVYKRQGYGFKGFSSMKAGMDKGQKRQFTLLNERIREGGKPLIPFGSILNTTKATFACITSLKERCWVNL